jgi:hypothetical protein
MSNSLRPQVVNYRKVLVLLEMQRRALQLAGSPRELLDIYTQILKFLKQLPPSQVLGTEEMVAAGEGRYSKRLVGDFEVQELTLDEIEKIVTDEKTPRRILEKLAIARFHVPKGSMRSFQNIGMLREKILIRVQNERTHQAIGELARAPRR